MEGNGNVKNKMNNVGENNQKAEKLSDLLKNIIPLAESLEKNTMINQLRLKNLEEKMKETNSKNEKDKEKIEGRLEVVEKYVANNETAKEEMDKLKKDIKKIRDLTEQKVDRDGLAEIINKEINTLVDDLDEELKEYVKKEELANYTTKHEADNEYMSMEKAYEQFGSKAVMEALDFRTHLHDKMMVTAKEEIDELKNKVAEYEKKLNEMEKMISGLIKKIEELGEADRFIKKLKEFFPGGEVK